MKRLPFVLALLLPTLAFAQQYSIDWYRISAGGGTSTGGTYSLTGTIAQPNAGGWIGASNLVVHGGFWATEVGGVRIIVPQGVSAVSNGGSFDGIVIGDGGTLTLGAAAPSSPTPIANSSIALTPIRRWKLTQLGNANAPEPW